jgi:hypothetical protein
MLERLLDYLNGLHRNIHLTMKTKKNGHISFLDIDIYRRPNGPLDHKVYRKITHTNFYLNRGPHHQPSNKQAVLGKLVLCMTRKASMMIWTSSRPLSGKMGKVLRK